MRRLLAIALVASGPLPQAFADEPSPAPSTIESQDGVPIVFTSKGKTTRIFVARGDVPAHAEPDPFEKLGVAPVTMKLSPGTYTVETEGPGQANGHQRFQVESGAPMTVEVHPGDSSLKALGGVLVALGITSIVLGVVAVVSFSKDDTGYNRWGLALPLGLGGAGGVALGWGLSAAGSTDVQVPQLPPGGKPHPAASLGPVLTLSF
jgi:hypothetical protein